MNYRKFGTTDLLISEMGFGAWALGGPAIVGNIPIGWGPVNDQDSIGAIHTALDAGINFFDTADFYGLGHSEELLGKTLGQRKEIYLATKVGQRRTVQDTIETDYSADYILKACEQSLKRLNREYIDFYQLHTAKCRHLEDGSVAWVMNRLQKQGKIRYWGISLNTFNPEPEGHFLLDQKIAYGAQLVFNMINQKALPLIRSLGAANYGIIARMPLQFGLLTGNVTRQSHFPENDHRSFRLTPELIEATHEELNDIWQMALQVNLSRLGLALSYPLQFPEISTVIPGMRTSAQVIENTESIGKIPRELFRAVNSLNQSGRSRIMKLLIAAG